MIKIDKRILNNTIIEIKPNILIVLPGVVVVATAGAGVGSVVVVVGVVVSVICNNKFSLLIYYLEKSENTPGSIDKVDIPTCCSRR